MPDSFNRRYFITIPTLTTILSACSKSDSIPPPRFGLDDEDTALRYKFRDIPKGGGLYVDATYNADRRQIVYQPNGKLFGPLLGGYGPGGGRRSSYFGDEKYGLPLPKYLRYQRFSEDIPRKKIGIYWHEQGYEGPPEVDVIVPVATRIPDEVLDRIRKYKGGLMLKFRMTPETILVGWQVINGESYPSKKDAKGRNIITDEDMLVGGDFCEARVVNRSVNGEIRLLRLKGWQIDPRTGKKIEMDY